MDSVREEVRAKAQRCAEDAYNSALAVQRGENVSESCTTIASRTTDAIMSALKRVPGASFRIKELEWEHVEGASDHGDAWFAKALSGLRYAIWSDGADGFRWELEAEDGDIGEIASGMADTIEAAQSACWDDLTKHITSAVEPSCVVTDAEAVYRAIKHGDDEHKRWLREACFALQDGLPVPPPRGGALSSRAEEEREVPAYVRERADEEIAQIKASVARSLTNGGA